MSKLDEREKLKGMNRVLFPLVYGILYLISLLPMWVLLRVSDFFFLIVYRLLGYRKKVVFDNLKRAFPDKPDKELQNIRKKFYQHLCDTFLETIKSLSLGDKELGKRVVLKTPESIEEIRQHEKGNVIYCTHYGNFEWMLACWDLHLDLPTYGIYTRIKNPVLGRLIRVMRIKRGMVPIRMQNAMRESLKALRSPGVIGFINDQSPSREPILYFSSLLGIPTAIHTAAAKLALKTKSRVYFTDMRKVGRGKYEMHVIRIPTERFYPYSEENAERLTDEYHVYLEKAIREAPPYWLWSHRRWKHSPKEGDRLSGALVSAYEG
ncbi:MAG: lipid A biosynthesis acyltransferase [Bacteroidota bacterium]